MTVQALRKTGKADALAQLAARPDLAGNVSAAARLWGWRGWSYCRVTGATNVADRNPAPIGQRRLCRRCRSQSIAGAVTADYSTVV